MVLPLLPDGMSLSGIMEIMVSAYTPLDLDKLNKPEGENEILNVLLVVAVIVAFIVALLMAVLIVRIYI